MVLSYPFDSHITGKDLETQLPLLDRAVNSPTLQLYLESMFTSGIMPNIERNLQVTSGLGMNVTVNSGICMCGGALAINTEPITLAIKESNPNLDRIDAVVVRKDNTDKYRNCDIYVKEGIESNMAMPPNIINKKGVETTSEVYEIVLAYVNVKKGTTSIKASVITDTRYNEALCGISAPYNQINTSGLFDQFEASFNAWFETIKGKLSTDIAGSLQTQIDSLSETLSSEIKAVNTKVDDAQKTANDAVNKANNAQKTANDGVSKANNAQSSANLANSRFNNRINSMSALAGVNSSGYLADALAVKSLIYDKSSKLVIRTERHLTNTNQDSISFSSVVGRPYLVIASAYCDVSGAIWVSGKATDYNTGELFASGFSATAGQQTRVDMIGVIIPKTTNQTVRIVMGTSNSATCNKLTPFYTIVQL